MDAIERVLNFWVKNSGKKILKKGNVFFLVEFLKKFKIRKQLYVPPLKENGGR